MKRFLSTILFLIAFILGHAPVVAQNASPEICATDMEIDPKTNAAGFFLAATLCAKEGQKPQVALMLVLGQIRAMTDLTVLTPSGEIVNAL